MIDAPILKRTEYPLLGLKDGFLQLQKEDGSMKDDVRFSEQDSMKEVNEQIQKFYDSDTPCLVTVLAVCGQEFPCAVREDAS